MGQRGSINMTRAVKIFKRPKGGKNLKIFNLTEFYFNYNSYKLNLLNEYL